MSQKFIDDNGKEHVLEIKIGHVKQIRKLHEVDLLADWESEDARVNLLSRLKRDIVLFGDVLAECVEGADEALFDGLKGDGLANAYAAFWKELVSFFPERAKREALALAVETAERTTNDAWKNAGETLAKPLNAISSSLPTPGAAPSPRADSPTK